MAKDIIDDGSSITTQAESTESANARTAYQNAKTAIIPTNSKQKLFMENYQNN